MVMKATQGEFQETTDGEYTLTLTGVKPGMLAFTDRPDRQAQRWDTTEFFNYWANEFGDDPPNAVTSADSEAAITINDPQVSGDTVTFTATPHRNPLESQGGPPQLLYLQVETRLIVGL
jgi:hypothetical protein